MPSKVIKRILSVMLTLTILLSLCPPYAPVSAEPEYDGFCVHHPAHTAECGYGEAVKGQPCTHVHDESCGYAEAVEEIPCDMECPDVDGDGIADHIDGCAYRPAAEGSPCTHTHDEICGYVEASEASPCTYAVNGCPYCVVSWEWVDDQQLLTRLEDGWGMGLPGAGEDNPLTREAVAELLPGAITAMTHSGEEVTLEISWDLTALPEESIPDGDYSLTAALPEAYALTEEAEALSITLQIGGAATYTALPEGEIPYKDKIVNGLSPNGTTIDLFDYWITSQTERDDVKYIEGNVNNVDKFINHGINANHALLFGRGMSATAGLGSWNDWTKSVNPRTGIVKNELGQDGFPVLNLSSEEISSAPKLSDRKGEESLAYLFDTNYHDGKAAYTDVRGLLQVDEAGYYYYNSTKNYAVYYEKTNSFTLYKYPGVIPGGSSPVGQFFPFNKATAEGVLKEINGKPYHLMNISSSTDASINHYFGIHMSTRFIQQNKGHTDSSKKTEVTYEFSGDDDIWIFIDGKLVADLGGIHDSASVKINFATGEIIINKGKTGANNVSLEKHTSLQSEMGLSGKTFEDNTYHTLDFFYLERGNTDSNMNLKYNLVTIPESDLIKVDQLGNPVQGAEFALYAADNVDRSNPIATGTTDSRGEFVFVRKKESGNEFPITITELYNKYKDYPDTDGNHLILVETKTPPGYRSMGEIGLYFYKADDAPDSDVLLLSNSTWDKGAYAMPKVTATTRNEISLLELAAGDEVKETVTLVGDGAVENPLMFAVVFQKQDGGTWLPVSGDPLKGWKVHQDKSWTGVLAAAKENPYIFQIGSSGAYQVEIDNLPGDIKTYYYICGNKEAAKYSIAYYYTKADSLDAATKENTWRIADRDTRNPLNRAFAMSLYVSNIKNRLLVQKVDEAGNPIDGATFCLYKTTDVDVDQNGKVTVKPNAKPYDTLTTRDIDDILKLDGGGIFPSEREVLELGEYYLVEKTPPYGYVANSTPVHIVVDNTGVYANAGTKDDGITVLRGVGSVMRSMVQFAADDDVNTTLQGIQAVLANDLRFNYYKEDGSFIRGEDSPWQPGKDILHLQYANKNKMLDYGLYDTSVEGTLDNLTLETDTGWSKLLIRQCYDHGGTGGEDPLKTPLGDADITNLFSGTVTVRVTNVRKIVDVTIEKKVTGNLGDYTKQFAFKIQSSLPMEKGTNYNLSDDGKTATFSLAHNESVTLKVPVGAELTIKEDVTDYKTTITVGNDELRGAYTVEDVEKQQITVTNHKDVVIDTGIALDALPYVVLLGIVAVGAILLLGRRRRRE